MLDSEPYLNSRIKATNARDIFEKNKELKNELL